MIDEPVQWRLPKLDFGWNTHTKLMLGWALFCAAVFLIVYFWVKRRPDGK